MLCRYRGCLMWGSCVRRRLLLSLGAACQFTSPSPAVPPCFAHIFNSYKQINTCIALVTFSSVCLWDANRLRYVWLKAATVQVQVKKSKASPIWMLSVEFTSTRCHTNTVWRYIIKLTYFYCRIIKYTVYVHSLASILSTPCSILFNPIQSSTTALSYILHLWSLYIINFC